MWLEAMVLSKTLVLGKGLAPNTRFRHAAAGLPSQETKGALLHYRHAIAPWLDKFLGTDRLGLAVE